MAPQLRPTSLRFAACLLAGVVLVACAADRDAAVPPDLRDVPPRPKSINTPQEANDLGERLATDGTSLRRNTADIRAYALSPEDAPPPSPAANGDASTPAQIASDDGADDGEAVPADSDAPTAARPVPRAPTPAQPSRLLAGDDSLTNFLDDSIEAQFLSAAYKRRHQGETSPNIYEDDGDDPTFDEWLYQVFGWQVGAPQAPAEPAP
ncbi:MAG: hypothetical protein ACFB3T_11130 [Geminicoccaceae bacterium]